MATKLTRLGEALDRESWLWLQDNDMEIATAVEVEVAQGATAEQIRRFVVSHVGADRSALATRCQSAARYLAKASK